MSGVSSDPDSYEPVENGPQMPASVSPEVFFNKMTETQRLQHLQDSLYQAALIRRDHRQNGLREKATIQSNYTRLLGVIEGTASNTASCAAAVGKVGSILNAIKRASAHMDAADHDDGSGTPRHYSRLERTDDSAYESLKKGMYNKDKPAAAGQKIAVTMAKSSAPKDVVLRASHAMTTIGRQKALEEADNRGRNLSSLRESMKVATMNVRKQFVRSSSYPRAMYSVGVYHDFKEKYDEQRRVAKRLQAVCDGLEPRDQEVQLSKSLEVMERQIINQLALIKGLREKVRILREQSAGSLQMHPAAGGCISPGVQQPQAAVPSGVFTSTTPPLEGSFAMPSSLAARATSPPQNSLGAVDPSSFSGVPNDSILGASSTSLQRARLGSALKMLSTPVQGPKGDSCAVVVLDLDSGKYLWETFPETLRTQTEILHRVIRTEAARWRGYEALQRDDKYMFAFSSAFDAVQFALWLQVDLVNAEWSTILSETPETATEYITSNTSTGKSSGSNAQPQYLWRGLRVKVGIDIGAQGVIDPVFPNRVSYEGPALETADYLQKLAVGGEVLVTHSVSEAIDELYDKLGQPLFDDWGTVTYHPSRVGIRRLTPRIFESRRATFNRALSTAERTLREEEDEAQHAPTGRVTLATVMCPGFSLVRASVSEAALRDTMQRVFHCVNSMCRSEAGYISQMNLDSLVFVVAFDDPFCALKFSIDLQQSLLDQDWSAELARVAQCAPVRIRDKLLYNGVRAQIGVCQLQAAAQTFREPMEGKTMYRSKDSKISTLMAAAAVDGEVLISDSLLTLVMDRYDELGCPISDYVNSIPTPASDTLLRLYQVFSDNLKERAAFVSRELRLADENAELLNADIVVTMRQQVQGMQKKLEEKNDWIRRLYVTIDEKTEAIRDLRQYVLKRPFYDVDVPLLVHELDQGFAFPNEVVLAAFSFAHVEVLFDLEAASMPDAIDIYDAFLDKTISQYEGREVRRLPSRIARIVAFPDAHAAMACWLTIMKTSIHEDWPPRLEDSTHAGLFMASELYPGLQPDYVVWRGLRPTCAMHSAASLVRFNTLTRVFEIIGDDVNVMAEMLRCAGPGDCLVSARFTQLYREKLERSNHDLQLSEYGPFVRAVDTAQRFRARAMNQTFPVMKVNDLPKSRHFPALVAHLMMQDTYPALAEDFPSDVAMYNSCVMRTVELFKGRLMSSGESEFVVVFENYDDGCRFAVHIHTELLNACWSRELTRVYDFRELHMDGYDGPVLRGIRAKVGCHAWGDLVEILDLFSGRDQWYHPQLVVPLALAKTAHPGETLASEGAREALRKAYVAKHVEFFMEPCGVYKLDAASRKESLYQVLPVKLKGRVSYFVDEDKFYNDPQEAALRNKAARVFRKRHDKNAAGIATDCEFLKTCERNTNPFDDPIHRKTHKLFQKIRPQLDEERSRFLTCQETLALIETVSMMAEDTLFLGNPDDGVPYYSHLMLHQLENGRVCKDVFYKKDLGAQLLGNVLLSDAPQTVELDAPVQTSESTTVPPPTSDVVTLHDEVVGELGGAIVAAAADDLAGDAAAKTGATNFSFAAAAMAGGAVSLRKTVFSTNLLTLAIHPEDVLQLHIDVEWFYQLLKLHGLDNPVGFAVDFMAHAFKVCYPQTDPDEFDENVRWKKITSLTSVIGMDVSSIDFQKLRCSLLAYLALAFEEITQFEF